MLKDSCCVNILGKVKGAQVSSSAGKELPTSWYHSKDSTDKESLVNLPAISSTAVNQDFVATVTLINSKHVDELMNFCLYQAWG